MTGTGGVFSGSNFTVDATATTSTFRYIMTGTSPCPNDTSVATVNVTTAPTAGTNGSVSICDNNTAAIDLFTIITGEDTGGTWTRLTGTGGTFSGNTFTPTAGATTSTFRYIVSLAGCPNDTSIATVNITAGVIAGTDGSMSICDNSTTAIDLFTIITGEQTGGTWTGGIIEKAKSYVSCAVGRIHGED